MMVAILLFIIILLPYFLYYRSTSADTVDAASKKDYLDGDDYAAPSEGYTYDFSIVIPVYNAAEVISGTLGRFSTKQDGVTFQVIMVDDHSDQEATRTVMRDFNRRLASQGVSTTVVLNDKREGFSKCVNRGVKVAKGKFIVLLNSDAILPPNALPSFLSIYNRDPAIGLVGPVSNAASYQSVPEIVDKQTKEWSVNRPPAGWDPEMISRLVPKISERRRPFFAFLNGFCFSFRRELFSEIGAFDFKTFGLGYGEENDFVLRARKAGYSVVIEDAVYVYHHKTASYAPEERKALAKNGGKLLKEKHGDKFVKESQDQIKQSTDLEGLRERLGAALEHLDPALYFRTAAPAILMLLPTAPLSLAESPLALLSSCMQLLAGGSYCRLAVPKNSLSHQALSSEEGRALVAAFLASTQAPLGQAFSLETVLFPFETEKSLGLFAPAFDVVIATSVDTLPRLGLLTTSQNRANTRAVPALLLRSHVSLLHEQLPPNTIVLADHLAVKKQAEEREQLAVELVDASVDFSAFERGLSETGLRKDSAFSPIRLLVLLESLRDKDDRGEEEERVLAALQQLRELEKSFPSPATSLEFHFLTFSRELALPRTAFPAAAASVFHTLSWQPPDSVLLEPGSDATLSPLSPDSLASLLSLSDLFVDLSTSPSSPWLALEAMLFGTVPIFTQGSMEEGGGSSGEQQPFAFGESFLRTQRQSAGQVFENGVNSLLLSSPSGLAKTAKELIESSNRLHQMKRAAREAAMKRCGPREQGDSLAALFSKDHVFQWRLRHTDDV